MFVQLRSSFDAKHRNRERHYPPPCLRTPRTAVADSLEVLHAHCNLKPKLSRRRTPGRVACPKSPRSFGSRPDWSTQRLSDYGTASDGPFTDFDRAADHDDVAAAVDEANHDMAMPQDDDDATDGGSTARSPSVAPPLSLTHALSPMCTAAIDDLEDDIETDGGSMAVQGTLPGRFESDVSLITDTGVDRQQSDVSLYGATIDDLEDDIETDGGYMDVEGTRPGRFENDVMRSTTTISTSFSSTV